MILISAVEEPLSQLQRTVDKKNKKWCFTNLRYTSTNKQNGLVLQRQVPIIGNQKCSSMAFCKEPFLTLSGLINNRLVKKASKSKKIKKVAKP